mgnify:CR=1 FL=1
MSSITLGLRTQKTKDNSFGYKIIDNISPSKKELLDNKRSRSARLRVIEKIK